MNVTLINVGDGNILITEPYVISAVLSCASQAADIPDEQLLVAVFPGIPTAAELFLLPPRNQSDGRKRTEEDLEQVRREI